jgi:excisionase family DNA binding protein
MSADDVQALLGIDKSTVYRMAQDGRLPAVKVGRQWRFASEAIQNLLSGMGVPVIGGRTAGNALSDGLTEADAVRVQPLIDLAAELLGVMMVVTDMEGNPASDVANPCAWFEERQDDPAVLDACMRDWRSFAGEQAFAPAFRAGPHGFECARALVREGNQLVGMVLAGGIAPTELSPDGPNDNSDGLYHLTAADRAAVLAALPRIAVSLSRVATRPDSTIRSE